MTLTAALFVGGKSTRMGCDKALLTVHGEPLWARQLQLLRELGPERIVVSCQARPSWCPADVESVPDEISLRGPMGGLVSVFARLETSHLMVFAVDLPRMNVRVLREVWTKSSAGCGVIPSIDGSFEPLCSVYPREAASLAREALDADRLSLQFLARTLIRQHLAVEWNVPDELHSTFLNANAPSDLERL